MFFRSYLLTSSTITVSDYSDYSHSLEVAALFDTQDSGEVGTKKVQQKCHRSTTWSCAHFASHFVELLQMGHIRIKKPVIMKGLHLAITYIIGSDLRIVALGKWWTMQLRPPRLASPVKNIQLGQLSGVSASQPRGHTFWITACRSGLEHQPQSQEICSYSLLMPKTGPQNHVIQGEWHMAQHICLILLVETDLHYNNYSERNTTTFVWIVILMLVVRRLCMKIFGVHCRFDVANIYMLMLR